MNKKVLTITALIFVFGFGLGVFFFAKILCTQKFFCLPHPPSLPSSSVSAPSETVPTASTTTAVPAHPVISDTPVDTSDWKTFTYEGYPSLGGFTFKIPDTSKPDGNYLKDSTSNGKVDFGVNEISDINVFNERTPDFYTNKEHLPVYFVEYKSRGEAGVVTAMSWAYNVVNLKMKKLAQFSTEVGIPTPAIPGIPLEDNLFRRDYLEAMVRTVEFQPPIGERVESVKGGI